MELKQSDTYHRRHLIHLSDKLGDKVADVVVTGMGSWNFIIIQTIIVVIWIALNVWLLTHPFDPYPMILLNLVFSTQAAYASPLILMSQNRQADKDRKRDDLEATEVQTVYDGHQLLLKINQQQLGILNQQTTILEILRQSQLGGGNSNNESNTKEAAASAITAPFNAINPSQLQQP